MDRLSCESEGIDQEDFEAAAKMRWRSFQGRRILRLWQENGYACAGEAKECGKYVSVVPPTAIESRIL